MASSISSLPPVFILICHFSADNGGPRVQALSSTCQQFLVDQEGTVYKQRPRPPHRRLL